MPLSSLGKQTLAEAEHGSSQSFPAALFQRMNDYDAKRSASLGEWILVALLVVNLSWTTLCLGGYRPETMVWSWLLTGLTLALHLGIFGFDIDRLHPTTWALLPFLIYGAINVARVSPVPWLGWRDWLGWVQMAATYAVVVNGIRRRAPRLLLLGCLLGLAIVAVILACYQRFLWPDWLMLGRKQAPQFFGRSSGPFGIPNSLAAFLLLFIPLLLVMTTQRGASIFQRILCGYFCGILLVGLGLTISRGAWFSLLGAVLVWPLCLRERTWEWRLTASLAATTLALLGGVSMYTAVPRVKQRFDQLVAEMGERSRPILWSGAWDLFKEAPIAGTGAGSFNVLFERHRPQGFRDEPQWAHNDYLNTLSDYGSIGFVLCFGGIAYITLGTLNRSRNLLSERSFLASRTLDTPDVTRGLAIGLLAFGVSLFVDFHLKIPALAMAVAVVGAECILRGWPLRSTTTPTPLGQLGAIFGAVAAGVLTLGLALPTFRSEAARYAARQEIDRMALMIDPAVDIQKEVLTSAAFATTEACLLQPANGQAWADRAYVSELWTRIAPNRTAELAADAEESARTALQCSRVVPEFWVRLGVALDLKGHWEEGAAAFGQAIQLAPTNAIVWYYQGYHLSLTTASRPLAIAALERALLLDPAFEPAIRLHQALSLPH